MKNICKPKAHPSKKSTSMKPAKNRAPLMRPSRQKHRRKLKLQRCSSSVAPPAGFTHARYSNSMVRSRHAQIRRLLYDEKCSEKQAWGLTIYLNDTFYPPEDALSALSSSVPRSYASGIEKGDSMASSSMSQPEVGRPPTTRDHFRTLLHKQRQASIRRRAFRIYHSREMDNVCFNVDREVASGKIISAKTVKYLLIWPSKTWLDMLLSYHPVWLRLGLETVFGEIIPMGL